jgi:putative ABC transport system substrate-binding protein
MPLLEATRTVPIVFTNMTDPVGAGFVKTMARPGGNATGFVQFEYSLGEKWPELLKQIAPGVTRVGVIRDPNITSGIGLFAVIQAVASTIGVEVGAINENDAGEIERDVADFARSLNGGLIVTPAASTIANVELIIALAAKCKLPAVYYRRYFAERGGLISYGYDILQQYRSVADYVDRILKGAKPADLPVQAPTKYELVINLKTANVLGHRTATAARPRRRGDRVILANVRYWHIADMTFCAACAFDPKRTSAEVTFSSSRVLLRVGTMPWCERRGRHASA